MIGSTASATTARASLPLSSQEPVVAESASQNMTPVASAPSGLIQDGTTASMRTIVSTGADLGLAHEAAACEVASKAL